MGATKATTAAFSLPPELAGSAPRDVHLTGGGRALIIAAWLLVGAAIPAGGALYVEAQRQATAAANMDRRGVSAPAVVDRLWRKTGDGKPAFAAFHFDVNGARIDGQSRMQLSAWRELRQGSTVRVRYLPESPQRFVIDGSRQSRLPFALAYFISSILAGLGLLCAAGVRGQRTLLSEGRPARAVVTEVHKHHSSHGGSHRSMHYEFPTLGGPTIKGKAAIGKPAEVGSTICIVYDPEKPGRNRPYPFPLVTVSQDG
jgi:hypothetical protein